MSILIIGIFAFTNHKSSAPQEFISVAISFSNAMARLGCDCYAEKLE